MPKRTAIIDIGSNSARLVIFETTSQYGFHLICEQKSKVRIGEGAYQKGGELQPIGIKRAYQTLEAFVQSIEKYQADNTICVATSALRDAPNGDKFVRWIEQKLGITIKIIDGKKEAQYGAIATNNLLPIESGITIDIGGGSSDMSLIQNGKIVDSYSLNLGTVRLKELFFDNASYDTDMIVKAKEYIHNELSLLPSYFRHSLAIGIGGTARTLSKGIMKNTQYPLDRLHAFRYDIDEHRDYLEAIANSSAKNLKEFNLKKNRYDTIREGTLIFNEILSLIGAKELISSIVGVREGLFLEQLLKDDNLKFPPSINPSIISILDRFKPFVTIEKRRKTKLKLASELYGVLQINIKDNKRYENELNSALRLSNIGKTLTVTKSQQHAFYIAQQELNYGYTHKEIILISILLRMYSKDLLSRSLYQRYKTLLPPKENLQWLNFIYSIVVILHEASNRAEISFKYEHRTLTIISDRSLYIAKEKIKTLEKPISFAIIIEDKCNIPINAELGID
ncbi:MAG: Ppx/GppA phosphatase family protein [Sulfurovum sp.]